jgi:hypothetical protein
VHKIRFPSLDELRKGLRCPKCDYSLRGHGEGDVSCPECGSSSDLQAAVLAGWRDRWNRTPWFRQLARAPLLFVAGVVAAMMCWIALLAGSVVVALLGAAIAGAVACGWVINLRQVRMQMPGVPTAGPLFLLHAIYLVVTVMAIVVLMTGFVLLMGGLTGVVPSLLGLAIIAPVAFGAVGAIWSCRRAERRLARRLAGRLLRRWVDQGTMSA